MNSTGRSSLHRRSSLSILAWLCGPTALLLALVAVVSFATGIPTRTFTADPLAIAGGHPLWGMLSNIGVLVWCAGATICLFTAVVLQLQDGPSHDVGFLLAAGLLTSLLLVDDLFMVHEWLAQTYLGVGERAFFALEASAVGLFLVTFRRRVLESNVLLLVVAFAFFGLSLAVDTMPHDWSRWHFLLEDGLKLFGIVTWSGYLGLTAERLLAETILQRQGYREGDSGGVGPDTER